MTDISPVAEAPPPAWWRLGPALWIGSVIVIMLAYLFINLPGNWFGGGATQSYAGSSMTILTGSARPEGGKLIVVEADAKNAVILTLSTPYVSTQQYGMVAFDIEGIPDNTDISLFWRNDLAPNKMFTRPLSVAGGHVQDVMLAGDTNWLGRIHTVGLVMRGSLPAPVTINGLALKPASASSILAERWRDWTDREAVSGISLSRIIGGRTGMELPLPLIIGLSVALASGIYFAMRRWRRWALSALTVAAIVMSGWLALDLRWQWNLASNALTSWTDFAGRDLSAKRLMGVDSEFEKIAVDIRPHVTQQSRLFIFAQDPGVAGRMAYLLLPAQIYYDITQPGLPEAERFKPGDLLLFHRKPGVRYSPDRKELMWDDRFRLRAEIVYAKRGAVLARAI